ncbi:hypothetical protein B0H13DRAFT_2273544 [Mycena leptocephala]|nr:hypothetical protein B0H13DRAFT_2273544 [Mycena leptocephala]
MLFNNIFTVIVVASVATLVHGIDLCAWPSANSCSGIATCCLGVAKNACCGSLVQTVGFSASYRPLESAVAFYQAWTSSNCGDGPIATNQVGPGDRCWTGLGTKANSIAWANFGDARRAAAEETLWRPHKGVEKAIRIPEHSGAIDTLIELYQKGDFATLEGYQAIERTGLEPVRRTARPSKKTAVSGYGRVNPSRLLNSEIKKRTGPGRPGRFDGL